MCAIAYIFIYRKIPVNVLFCMLAIGIYWDLIVTGGGGGVALDVLKICG